MGRMAASASNKEFARQFALVVVTPTDRLNDMVARSGYVPRRFTQRASGGWAARGGPARAAQRWALRAGRAPAGGMAATCRPSLGSRAPCRALQRDLLVCVPAAKRPAAPPWGKARGTRVV